MNVEKSIIRTRFAPSPTGEMHFGNARTALFNYLVAKHSLQAQAQGGEFILRLEDTDQTRSTNEFIDGVLEDLVWLGLQWDNQPPFYQSKRGEIYQRYYEQLQAQKQAYYCFCSDEQLQRTRKLQLASGQPPRYPGTCRSLSTNDIQQKLDAGEQPVLRFLVPPKAHITFTDVIKGPQEFFGRDIGDFIIRRHDGSASFMFANAIDDALMNITYALRGDDHLTNSPRQYLILEALGLTPPQYGHFPTILGEDGARLSKRNGSVSIKMMREAGYRPLALSNYLARLGHHYSDNTFFSLLALAKEFEFSKVTHSSAKYDKAQLNFWQKEAMLTTSEDQYWGAIETAIDSNDSVALITTLSEDQKHAFAKTFWPNLLFPIDAQVWLSIIFEPMDYAKTPDEIKTILAELTPEWLQAALALLAQPIEYDRFISELKAQGISGKRLFKPLRAILTARLDGPPLLELFNLLGQETVIERFKQISNYVAHL